MEDKHTGFLISNGTKVRKLRRRDLRSSAVVKETANTASSKDGII